MNTGENRKLTVLPRGWKIEPLYSKCPDCGCDLKKLPADLEGLQEAVEELVRQERNNRTRMEKKFCIAFKWLSLKVKLLRQRLADKCLKMWK